MKATAKLTFLIGVMAVMATASAQAQIADRFLDGERPPERPAPTMPQRLSCRTFAANAVRLQLHALAYNLGNFLRTLATPEPINIPRQMFQEILRLIAELRPQPPPAPA